MRTFLTRILILATLLVLGYFVAISTDTGKVPTQNVAPESGQKQLSEGKGLTFQAYDASGREINSGKFGRIVQEDEDTYLAEEVDLNLTSSDGSIYHVIADTYDTRDDGSRVLSAQEGNQIRLRERDGITIETPGPLIYSQSGVLFTEAQATFSLANIKGACQGLRYKSGNFLRLLEDVRFQALDQDLGDMDIVADFLNLSMKTLKGEIRNGIIASSNDAAQSFLKAPSMDVYFRGQVGVGPYSLREVLLDGDKNEHAIFRWAGGELRSSHFFGCFNESGHWIEMLRTAHDAHFSTLSNDGYWFEGTAGKLTLLGENWQPKEMSSTSLVDVTGRQGSSDTTLRLNGTGGLQTIFRDGTASSTRIFGKPTFSYGQQEGEAGSLRVLHDEHQVLFSAGASLQDTTQDLTIKGDEILLANWDQEQREIFAFKFVEILRKKGTPEQVQCFGDTLEMKLPSNDLKLTGEPAKLLRNGETIEGQTVQLKQVDAKLFDVSAQDEVVVNLISNQGTFWIQSRTMDFKAKKRLLQFDKVLKAVIPDQGELSGERLNAYLLKAGEGMVLDRIEMRGNVVFKGWREVDGKRDPITCQADEMDYQAGEETLRFTGVNREVIFSDSRFTTSNRGLIYNLKSGTLSGYSEKHRTSTIKVPLDKSSKGEN